MTHPNRQSMIPCITLLGEFACTNRSEPWFQWADQRGARSTHYPDVDGKPATSERHWRWLIWCKQQRKVELDRLAHEQQQAAEVQHGYAMPSPVTPWNQPVPQEYEMRRSPEMVQLLEQTVQRMASDSARARNETAVQQMDRQNQERIMRMNQRMAQVRNPEPRTIMEQMRHQIESAVGIPEPVASATVAARAQELLDAGLITMVGWDMGAGESASSCTVVEPVAEPEPDAAARAEYLRIRGLGL